ncbi:MAG TPA: hypothetical protein VKU41_14325, partial [Polyangiaceae bacterium]|nr:hypothetical protein [Polyangiaceae bacterium]
AEQPAAAPLVAQPFAAAVYGAADAALPVEQERPTLVLVAAAGALLWTLLLLAAAVPLIVVLTRSREAGADGREDPTFAALASSAAARALPPAPSEAPVPDSPPPAPPAAVPFSISAARRALDATTHDVGRCRKGKVWGYAFATVTFSGDGSVGHVDVGSPFTGTDTASCVADALGAARMDPFAEEAGRRPFIVYKFYVAPR